MKDYTGEQSPNTVEGKRCSSKRLRPNRPSLSPRNALSLIPLTDTLQIIGAPSFFPTIWSWVKRWFDPIVVSKMFILSDAEVLPTLTGFMAIEDIPEKYGGKLKFRFGDMPNIGGGLEELVFRAGDGQASGWTVPKGTVVWEQGSGEEEGLMVMVNVGSVDGEQKREVLGHVKGKKWKEVMYPTGSPSPVAREDAAQSPAATATATAEGVGVGARDVSATPTTSSSATATEVPASTDGLAGADKRTEVGSAHQQSEDAVPAIPTAPGPPVKQA